MNEHNHYATFTDTMPGATHLERLDLNLVWDLSVDAARIVTHTAKTWQHGMSNDLPPVLYDRFVGLRKDIDDTMVEERYIGSEDEMSNMAARTEDIVTALAVGASHWDKPGESIGRRIIQAEARWTPTEVLLIPYLRERIKRKGPGTYEARLLLAEVKRTCDMRMCAAWLAPDVVALPATAHIATELERRMAHRQVFNPTVQRWLDWLPRCL